MLDSLVYVKSTILLRHSPFVDEMQAVTLKENLRKEKLFIGH